jgi:outer membrane protein TolC
MSLAAENLRLREASFAEGLSTAIDLREARTQLVGAEIAQRAAACW